MVKRILAATIVLSLVFISACSEISELSGGLTRVSSAANPEITTKLKLDSKWQMNQIKTEAVADSSQRVTESDETNNAQTFAFPTLAPDLTIETITWSPANPSIKNTVTFIVTIKNQGGGKAGSSHVACYIDDTYLTSAFVSPIDAGATATKTFTWKAQDGPHAIKAVADSNQRVTESDETNNAQTFTFSTLAPDLTIEMITWLPANPSKGDTVTFGITIKNQGSGKARRSHVYLYIDGSYRGYREVQRIDAGATVTKSFNWTARPGSHAIKAVADSSQRVAESDETNNAQTITFSTLAPDLIIKTVTWSPVNPSKKGATVTFSVTIRNQGSGRADYSRVACYIDDTCLASALVSPIDAGATATETLAWRVQTGSHAIQVVADSSQNVAESDETNNAQTVAFSGPSICDLIIQSITWSPASPSIEDTVTFTVTIKNQGGTSARSTRIAYYIDGSSMGYEDVPEIAAGATATKTFTWAIRAGSHTIKAVADSNQRVTESDETNNAETVTFSGPSRFDLIVQDIAWAPASPSIGDTVTFTVTIKNQGSDKTDHSYAAYYIDDAYLTSAFVSPIDPGGTINKTFAWTAQTGSHTIKVVADSNQRIPESNETNNTKTVTFSALAPDLIVQNITWPPVNPSIGDTVTFAVTIKNQGSGKADSSRVAYYIDGSSRGYHNVLEIEAGATVTKSFTWIAQDGPHTIKAVADEINDVAESDETNNAKTVTFSIFLPPVPTPTPAPTPTPVPTTSLKQQEVSVHLYGQSTEIPVGQDIVLILSAVNLITKPTMTVQLILEVPSGMSVTPAEFIKGDRGQYAASYSVEPGNIRQIEVPIRANQEGSFSITGYLAYYFAGDKSTAEYQTLSLPVTVGNAGAPAEKPTPVHSAEKGIWLGWWLVSAGVVLGGIVIIAILRSRQRYH